LDQQLLESFAARLRKEEGELATQIAAYDRARLASLKDSIQELSSYDNHPGDLGSETLERSKDLALLDNVRELRRQVKQALARMENGTYGRCVKCGQPVDLARLEAIPHAELCLECRKNEEAWDPPRWRPIEEESLAHGFGDRPATPGVNGEDIWEDVAEHGSSETPSDLVRPDRDIYAGHTDGPVRH